MGQLYSTQNVKVDSKRVYGYIPDVVDPNDKRKVCMVHPSVRNGTIKVIDMRDRCPSVYNQGKLGSCTANALCGNYAFIYMKENNLPLDREDLFSRLFVYWNERQIEGTTDKDSGASLRDGIRAIDKYGVPLEKYWPYDIAKFAEKPSEEAYLCARHHVPTKSARLDKDADQLRQCLANGDPFVFGFTVYESFESEETAKTGIMTVPKPDEKILGGHAVMCVGYDYDKKLWIVRNSWGPEWGDKGYFYMPDEVMFGSPSQNKEITEYTTDFWCIEVTKDVDDTVDVPENDTPDPASGSTPTKISG
ncbi:peptidase C1 [Yasminevirus sp. GU-2018]|uniref:Peptidase C1 n=1 Tax=Yasminevirus sp. GU-2018 TaxID=2420051 RepID=A0A5K0U8C9_9VIRU|nr:peptidase C1 [Yasminevirus sp. GU-2018]